MLKIRCFAPALQVALNDQPISLTEQPALLLAYLVAHDGPASRADIARLFWPQSPEKNQSEQLRNALRSLKIGLYPAQLETYVQTQPPGFLTIDPAHVDADTRALTRAAANPRASLDDLERAAALYQGEFLSFIKDRKTGRFAQNTLPDADIEQDLDDWHESAHQRYRAAWDEVLRRLISHHARDNNFEAVARWGERWQAHGQPTQEAFCEILVALHELDQHAAMDHTYQRAINDYPESLEIERGYRALKTPSIRHNLPALTRDFMGRERVFEDALRHLQDPSARLITVYGLGGIGKSALALRAAHHARQNFFRQFSDGVFWVALENCASVDACAQAINRAILAQTSLNERANPRQRLLDVLREKRLLLILDDADFLLERDFQSGDGALADGFRGFIMDVFHTAQNLKLIVTARAQMDVSEEMPIFLEGLTYPLADESLQLEKHIAGQLFVSAATQSMGGKFHAAPQAPSIAEICRQTEGMPLALRLAASQLPARAGNCKELADAIGACYRVLQTTARDVPSRHRSAQAVFETSWQVLDASLQTILAQLSLFKGGISPKAAQTVTGATEQQMGQLARRALLQIDESSGRFFLHALLRQFCAEKFLGLVDEVARQAKLAYLDFFASLAESAHANISMLTGEWANMLNATGVAHSAQHWQMVIRLTQNMAEAWNTAGRYTDARTAYALACDAAQKTGDDHALVGFLAQWGRACVRQADYAEAQHHFERGRELAHKPIDAMNIALIDYEMAQLDIELGRAQTAHERLDECLDIAEELNLASLIGETYRQKARVHYNTHDTENAEDFARRALQTHQTHSPPALQLLALRVLGDVIRELWALDQQERHRLEYESLWQTAMRLNTEVVKDAREECILRYSRLQFLRIRKEWDAFEQEWPECDRQLRRIGDRKTQIHLNTLRGYVFLEQNKFAQAVERIEQSVGWLTEANSADQTIHPLMQLSKSWQGLGNAGKAAACLQRARDTARRYGHPLLGRVEAALSALGAD